MGKHITEVNEYELGITFQVVTAAYVCWTLGTGAVKLSVLILYTRIFRTAEFRWWASVIMGAVGAFTIAFFVVFLTNCTPVSQEWNPVPWGHCRDQSPSEFGSVSCSLAIDFAIIVLPFPWLWKLQMPMRNKITVSITLSIGFTTIGVMFWRIPVTIQSANDGDFTYHLLTIALITMLELWLGIIVACIPTLAPLLNRYVKPAVVDLIKSIKNKTGGGSSNNTYGDNDRRAINLVTIGGTGGSKTKHGTGRIYTELDDSQEAINDLTKRSGHRDYSASDLESNPKGGEVPISNQNPYGYPPFGQPNAHHKTDIAFDPKAELRHNCSEFVPQGAIHVQRDFSTSHEP
ncbi:hypothetical protein N0V82_006912 [Gnomoniopsis sp. IMI 355080]|nr:hypothetical protein N0V82_006912 [Gnomoniopsis sp. IMI 355080]